MAVSVALGSSSVAGFQTSRAGQLTGCLNLPHDACLSADDEPGHAGPRRPSPYPLGHRARREFDAFTPKPPHDPRQADFGVPGAAFRDRWTAVAQVPVSPSQDASRPLRWTARIRRSVACRCAGSVNTRSTSCGLQPGAPARTRGVRAVAGEQPRRRAVREPQLVHVHPVQPGAGQRPGSAAGRCPARAGDDGADGEVQRARARRGRRGRREPGAAGGGGAGRAGRTARPRAGRGRRAPGRSPRRRSRAAGRARRPRASAASTSENSPRVSTVRPMLAACGRGRSRAAGPPRRRRPREQHRRHPAATQDLRDHGEQRRRGRW